LILGFDFRKGSLGFSFSVKNRIVYTCGLKLLQQVGTTQGGSSGGGEWY